MDIVVFTMSCHISHLGKVDCMSNCLAHSGGLIFGWLLECFLHWFSGVPTICWCCRFRVVYRLVNSVYVLGISSADQDDCANNVFDCTSTVNQAVRYVPRTELGGIIAGCEASWGPARDDI